MKLHVYMNKAKPSYLVRIQGLNTLTIAIVENIYC